MALCLALTGCQAQKEESAKEKLTKYTALESVSDYTSLSAEYLQAVADCADRDSPSSIQDMAKARANLEIVCDKLIEETEVPEKCKDLHEEFKTAAEKLEEAGKHYSDANIAINMDDTIGYNSDLNKAAKSIDEASGAIQRANDLMDELNASENSE